MGLIKSSNMLLRILPSFAFPWTHRILFGCVRKGCAQIPILVGKPSHLSCYDENLTESPMTKYLATSQLSTPKATLLSCGWLRTSAISDMVETQRNPGTIFTLINQGIVGLLSENHLPKQPWVFDYP